METDLEKFFLENNNIPFEIFYELQKLLEEIKGKNFNYISKRIFDFEKKYNFKKNIPINKKNELINIIYNSLEKNEKIHIKKIIAFLSKI